MQMLYMLSPPPPHTHTQLPTDRVNLNVIESTPTNPQVAHLYYANTPTAHHGQAMKAEANAYVHVPPGTTSVMNSTHRMQIPQPQASSHGFTPPHYPYNHPLASSNTMAKSDIQPAMLTPDHFQQPVQMLNTIQQGLSSMQPPYSIGGGGGSLPHMQNFMSPSGTKLDIGHKKRRTSSTSAPSLDDQGLCSGSSI